MREEDKAATTIPKSPSQDLISKVDRRDKLVRGVELFVLACVVGFNIFLGLRLQQVINQNNASTVAARQQNIDRQNDLKNYIKCLSLVRFNQPPVDLSSKTAVSKALDQCAQTN